MLILLFSHPLRSREIPHFLNLLTMAFLFSLTSRHALPFHLVRRPRLYDAVSLPSVYNYKFCVRSSTGFCKSDLILGKQRKLEGANIRGGLYYNRINIFVSK